MSEADKNAERRAVLSKANKERLSRATERTKKALVDMIDQGVPVSVASVAREADVSRSFLYAHEDLLSLVTAAQSKQRVTRTKLKRAEAEAGSIGSLQARLSQALEEITRLKVENQSLEKRVANLTAEIVRLQEGSASGAANVVPINRTRRQL